MQWMAWTFPTAVFFALIVACLLTLTVCELDWPTARRRGWLPLATTRGDRFFISLLLSAFLHALWLGMTDLPPYLASAFCLLLAAVLMRWG